MNSRSATGALVFASVGHFFAHLLMLLYPTVLLVIEVRWGMSYGDLLSLALGGFVLFGLGALPARAVAALPSPSGSSFSV